MKKKQKKLKIGDPKVKKKKLKSLSFLRKKLDKIFSEWIRRKDSNDYGENHCYTCGKLLYWKQLQCGHYISRRHYSTRWLESNCKPQCVGCNIFNQGNGPMFAIHLIEEYGSDHLNYLNNIKNLVIKFDRVKYEKLIQEIVDKLDAI